MERVDCHQHFWSLQRGDYVWLTPELTTLYKDYLPHNFDELRISQGIDRTILVQAAPTIDETRYLLSLANDHDFIGGVVGWVDLESQNSVLELKVLSKNSKFKGIRPMLQDITDARWILNPEHHKVINALQRLDLTFDALVTPIHLPALKEFAHRYPELSIVIDHAAKPDIAGNSFNEWALSISEIAQFKNVYCKISGLLTEAQIGSSSKDLSSWVDHLIECFGSQRLMWGSDWPVLNLASDYKSWVEMSEVLFAKYSNFEKQNIFGGTASDFYKL